MINELSTTMHEKLEALAQQQGLSIDDMLDALLATYNRVTKPSIDSNERLHRISQAQLFKGLFEQSVDAVILLDLDGNHIDCNQRASELLGYPRNVLKRLSVREIVKQDEQAQSKNMLQRLLSGEILPPYKRIFIHQNGHEIPVELNVECMFDEDGNPLYIQSIVRDIQERQALIEQLKTNETWLGTILYSIAEGMVIHDHTGAIIHTNPAAHELLGLTADQLHGLTPISPNWRTIHEDGSSFPGETHPASVSLKEGITQSNVVMGVYKPDNSLTWLSVTSVPILSLETREIDFVIATFTDITALKTAQHNAINLAVEQQRTALIADFIRDARHEFRTPLTIITTNTYLIRKALEKVGMENKRLKQIDDHVMLIQKLVDALALMAKLDFLTMLDLDILIKPNESIATLAQKIQEQLQGRQLIVEEKAPHNAYVATSDTYLSEALDFMMDNAIRNTPDNGTIILSASADEETVSFSIEDNGVGISEDDMQHIFERFWRKDIAHSKEGLGLGLPITKRIVELHNGTIDVTSKLDEGTTITMTFPRAK